VASASDCRAVWTYSRIVDPSFVVNGTSCARRWISIASASVSRVDGAQRRPNGYGPLVAEKPPPQDAAAHARDESRALQRRLEETILPLATSIDGRRFTFHASLHELALRLGGYVRLDSTDGTSRLGQVLSLQESRVDGPEVDLDLGAGDGPSRYRVGIRFAAGDGVVLEGEGQPFHDAAIAPATSEEVASWLTRVRPSRAMLAVGALGFANDLPLELDAGGFDRHTFLCGQSGSGKTYALGTILERILVETSLRIVILDPNSDFVRLTDLRGDAPGEIRGRYETAAAGVAVRRALDGGADRLHVRFRDFDATEQAAVLRLDPIADREEYAALMEAVASVPVTEGASIRDAIDRMWAFPDPVHSLGVRARNLGVDRWQIWSAGDSGSIEDLVAPGGPRAVVVDLGSLGTREEQAVAAESTLAALWRRRSAREPILIVVDEAHNVCPGAADDPLTAMATEHAVRIAGEGRKFGLVLLVATQRPQKVHENVVSQCDNLVLMRMNSRSDLTALAEAFSFVPAPLLGLATDFKQGEAVVAGKLVPGTVLGRFGPRWSVEGGSDIPADWARPA
jgi:hypothetical protein